MQWVDLLDLKAHVDLNALFGYGKVMCPWHADHTPSLQVYSDHVHCFSCGATHDGIDYVRARYDMSWANAVQWLFEHKGTVRVDTEQITEPLDAREFEALRIFLSNSPDPEVKGWLFGRGLSMDMLNALSIGWDGIRYSIPHFANGLIWNVKYRIHPKYLKPGEHKYDSPPHRGFPYLYPWDYFRQTHNNSKVLFITEGELDAALLLQHGLPALSVPSGVQTNLLHWEIFLRQFQRIYILYDMDAAGIAAANKMNTEKTKEGATVVETLRPAEVQRLTWPIEWGKDVTDAREKLIPILKGVCSA